MLAAARRAHSALAAARDPILAPGPDTVEREICALSGLAANAWCPNRKRDWVAAETTLLPCGWHHLADGRVLTFLPAEYQAWAEVRDPEPPRMRAAQPANAGHGVRTPHDSLTITSPLAGATYLIDPTLRREFQTLPFKAAGAAPGRVVWSVDGRPVNSRDSDLAIEWPLAAGRHRIAARDSRGRTAEIEITVR